jgi:hypothetical protein
MLLQRDQYKKRKRKKLHLYKKVGWTRAKKRGEEGQKRGGEGRGREKKRGWGKRERGERSIYFVFVCFCFCFLFIFLHSYLLISTCPYCPPLSSLSLFSPLSLLWKIREKSRSTLKKKLVLRVISCAL